MKRRVLSFIITLALCLNLCPVWASATDAGTDGGLCPHHLEHTDECGYALPALEQECTHSHDEGCYITEADCIHEHTAECYPESDDGSEADEPVLCAHMCTQDSGCITQTLSCLHEHDDTCGYVDENPGAPCTFVCHICPIEDLIGKLPLSVSESNSEQVHTQLSEIYARYDELTEDEQQEVDLSACVSLLEQMDEIGTEILDGEADDSGNKYIMPEDKAFDPYVVSGPMVIDTNGHTLSGINTSAIRVTETGELDLVGKVTSPKGTGVEVQSGGSLSITGQGTVINGKTYALDIASGAEVQLSTGTYIGQIAAIQTEDGDFGALLAPGCAYFDAAGDPILLDNMGTAKAVAVGQCTTHSKESCTTNTGTTTHTWTCVFCKTEESEPCTFTFDQDGNGTCVCGNTLTIVVDESDLTDLVYDGTIKPEDVKITVTLADGSGKELEKGSDYSVEYEPRTDAGEITVTVTGITFNGTFTRTYQVSQDRPALEWDTVAKPVPVEVDYDGDSVEESELPPVKINIKSDTDNLQDYLKYSYKKENDPDSAYTDGLPTNAGTYEVIVSLPEMQNFEAAFSEPITLTIRKINPIVTPPTATKPVFNRDVQELVTGGTLCDVAVRDGVTIKFAESENGEYSTTIPTGTNAGNYNVWYTVEGTENYLAIDPDPTEVAGVEILRKPLEPIITLSDYTYLYDGGYKQPTVTVKDDDNLTVLLDSEYRVEYQNNRDVGTAKVVVTDKPGGNYDITETEAQFQITARTQETLSITQKPNTITYGDKFTLSTSGGSGSGNVTWEVTSGSDVAEVDRNSGQVTVIGHGAVTIKATKSGLAPTRAADGANYEDATASWEFTADKKPVTVTVTAEDKDYDGDNVADVHAEAEQGVLAGDEIMITGLTGTFSDENAGADKTVTVDVTSAAISGNNSQHYEISYSSLTVKAAIRKAVAEIAAPGVVELTYNGVEQNLISTGAAVNIVGVNAEYALSEDGPYSTAFPQAKNAGTYTVWYRVEETDNYIGQAPKSVEVRINKKPVAPEITLSGDGLTEEADGTYSYIYSGDAREPAVTLTEADGITEIPAGEYTVSYSDNVNVGTAANVTVTAKADGNYSFAPITKNFAIKKEQARVIAAPEAAGDPLTFNTRAQKLVTAGTGTGGTMVYSVNDQNGTYLETIPTETNAAEYTVYYKVAGDPNHSDSEVGSVAVTIAPKTVKDPTIELYDVDGNPLVSYTYDGTAKAPSVLVKDGSTPIHKDEYNIVYSDNTDAGRATVSITDKPGGNYTVTGSAEFVIVKANIVFDQAPTAAVITYDGKAHELLIAGKTSGGEVLYALNSETSTYSTAIPKATEAGDYTVYYKVVGDKNHNDFAAEFKPVTIKRKPLTTLTIELDPASFEYDGTVKLPSVTVKDGDTVLPKGEYTWACNDAAPMNQGTYTITVTDAALGNYDLTGVTANTATFTIGRTAQAALEIEGKPAVTNYGDNFKLTVSGGSGSGAISWSTTGPASADTDGNVTINGVGEVTITAEKAADDNYLSAQTQWTFTAAPKPVMASVTVDNKDYDGTSAATVASVDINADLLAGDAVTIDPASIAAVFDTPAAGTGKTVTLDTANVRVAGASAANYDITYPDTATADITRAKTQITTSPEKIDPLTYSGQPQELITAGKTNVGLLVYSLSETGEYSQNIPTGTDAGTYTVYYKVDETADYTGVDVNTTPLSVTIGPKPVTPVVELSESSFLYDGTKKNPKITLMDGKTVIDADQYTVAWDNDLTSAGTHTATISKVGGKNYTFADVTAEVEITEATQAALKITGKHDHVYYGDTFTLDTEGGSGNGTVAWSITAGIASAEIDGGTGKLTVKGTGPVTVEAKRTVPNYGTVSDTWTFTVEPKPVMAEVTIAAKVYDGSKSVSDTSIIATVKSGDLVDPDNDTVTISGLRAAYEDANAGTNKMVTLDSSAATATADDKYAVSYPNTSNGDITPRQVDLTVTLSGNDLKTDDTDGSYYYEYDGTDKTPAVKATADDDNAVLAAGDYTVNYADNKNVGKAAVTVTAKVGGNYTFDAVTVNFDIRKAAAVLTQTPKARELTYNGTAQELVDVGTAAGGTVWYSGTGAEDSYSAAIPQGTEAGTYTVYYMVKGDANHTDTAPSQVSVTIKAKEITPAITLNPNSYEYDGTAHEPAVTVKDGNKEIPDSEYSVSYRDNVSAGTATVIVIDNNDGNYIVNGTATFQITKKAPAFTPPEGKTGLHYNGELQELVKAGVSGEGTVYYSVNGGNYSTAIPMASTVGTYNIDYKVVGDDNHSDTDPVSLDAVEIAKNTVTNPTITLSSDTFQYNGSQQKPVITVRDDNGRLIPENEYVVTITGNNGNNMVDADTYTVTITTPDASNYIIESKNTRTFTIVPADQETISITGTRAQVCYGDVIQLGTTGGAGSGTVNWKIEGNTDTTITQSGLLAVKDVGGPITVTATRSRGGNYSDVSAKWEFSAEKKQVTAVLTGVDRTYAADDRTAAVKAVVPNGELVSGDSITIGDLTGTFDDANVGTNKKVTVDRSAPAITGTNSDKYTVTIPATATASILAAPAAVDAAPEEIGSLIYDASQAQVLVTAGTVTGGIMVYSLDGTNYTPAIPKAKDAGKYTVYYKAQGDSNHTDSEARTVEATIAQQPVTPRIELTPSRVQYDGNVKKPDVTVLDAANNVIPASEYTVVYDSATNWKDVGPHKVTVQNVEGGNYKITEADETFTISKTPQNPLEIVDKPSRVYYGDTFTLSAVGGSGSGSVTWKSDDEDVAKVDANGVVTIRGTGPATITAERTGGTNYDTVTADYPLNALKKTITAVITADDKPYDGDTSATLHVSWKEGALVGNDSIAIETLTGTFDDEHVGTNKTVTITCTFVSDATSQKYDIKPPFTTTASILKADATAPTLTKNERVYDGTTQALVSGGDADTLYSGTRDGVYSEAVPTGTNAGTYTVWYKARGGDDHNDSAPQSLMVTISPKPLTADGTNTVLSGSDLQTDDSVTPPVYYYEYDGTEKRPTVIVTDGAAVVPAGEYTLSYSDNKNVNADKKAVVTITDNEDGNYIVSGSVEFEIRQSGAELTSSPRARDLTYQKGTEQELVDVGTATGGHIEYALDGGEYSRDIPKAENAGTYTVTYKVVGDANHTDGTAVGSVTVTIKPKTVVSPKITVDPAFNAEYDGNAKKPGITVMDGTDTIDSLEYSVSYSDNINAGEATVIVSNNNGGNYTVNGTATFEILKADIAVADVTAPEGLKNLPYNGAAQELARPGSAANGTMVYSLDENGEYSSSIPTGKNVGAYTVWYKVQGDTNHNDSEAKSVDAEIIKNTVTKPTIQVTPESVTYNGDKQAPTVTVKDDNGIVIDGSEYTVTYADAGGNSTTDLTNVGTYTLTITGKGTSYDFTATAAFKILPAGQTPLTITGKRERVCYGDTIKLDTEGGSGTVTWDVGGSAIATITSDGLLEITGVGSVIVTATSEAIGYNDQTATWSFHADKKPVTAVVTAEAKTYDSDTAATVTATLQSSDLVAGDEVKITLKGSFEDPNVGTDKKVNIDSTNPVFSGDSTGYENYSITYPATATASILKADVKETDITAPTAADGLEYTGLPLTLVTEGAVTGGTMEYSLDDRAYSASLPTGTNAGDYDVWYRVKGDGNHNDTAGTKLDSKVTVAPQNVPDPIIEFSPSGASYDGAVHKPEVTVKDNNGRVIPEEEYDVDYGNTDWKAAGGHTVTITGKTGGNYSITQKPATFTILVAGQSPLSITNQPGRVQYGDTFTLSAVGGSGTGIVKWDSNNKDVATIDQNGLVRVHKSGPVKITATKLADGGYGEVSVDWSFSAEKKPVTPIVTARDKEYDTYDDAQLVIKWQAGDLLNGDTINLALTGTFEDANVGTNKTVAIAGTLPDDDRYDIKLPEFPTASITPKAASVTGVTVAELEYNGSRQPLVSGGTATGGTIAYSRDGSYYVLSVPSEKNAGTYTVYYKAQAEPNGNYKDSPVVRADVTIAPKSVTKPVIELSSDTFDYDGTPKRPDVEVKDGNVVIPASEYTVSYSNNTAVGTATVTISDADDGNYEVSGSTTFTIKAGVPTLTDEPQPRSLTYNGRAQTLVTRGTAVNGLMMYSLDEYDDYSTSLPKKTDAGVYEVWYKVVGDDDTETDPESVIAEILPKPVTPTVTVNLTSDPLPYTGSPQKPPVTVVVDGKTLTNGVDYTTTYSNNTNAGTATAAVQSVSGSNYQFSATATFEIAKSKATFAVLPEGLTDLVYTGEEQELIEENTGISLEGTVLYSLNAVTYSAEIPTGIKVRSYTIFAKIQGDSKHEDSDPVTISAQISTNEVKNPRVTLSFNTVNYNGGEQKPSVTVTDENGNVIPASEYVVTYSNNINVGKATVAIESKGSNYSFTAEAEFEIVGAGQTPLIITGKQDTVYYGDTLRLGTDGGAGDGAVTWSVSGPADEIADGQFKLTSSGSVTITATKAASGGYGEATDTWSFYAKPKPITAAVTAADKTYDTNNTAKLTVTIGSGLVGSDTFTVAAQGHFTDENVGANKIVVIDRLDIPEGISEKYDISYPDTTTASITPKAASVTDAPERAENLKYTGSEQALLTSGGTADSGNLAYSVDGGSSYSFEIPTGTDAKSYTVWYKVVAGDENHKDSLPLKMEPVTIAANTDTPSVLCMPATFQYDGTEKTPTVVVRDKDQRVIPEREYTVTFEPNRIAVDTYTVTVTDNPGGNYEFTAPAVGSFEIVEASQSPLSIITDKPTNVCYGDTFRLSAMGGSGNGAIQWSIAESSVAEVDANGVVTVKGTGGFTVKAYREGTNGYSDSNTDSVPFVANPKPVTPVVTAEDKTYDGKKTATLHAAWKSGDLVGGDEIAFTELTGEFATADAGTGKQVKILTHTAAGTNADKYTITWPDSTTASIYRVDAKLETKPGNPSLTYTGSEQALVTGGKTVDNIGTIVYSLSQNGTYSEEIPTARDAGKYIVWYKVADSVNYTGINAASIEVEILKATPSIDTYPTASGTEGQSLSNIKFTDGGAADVPGKFAWEDGSIRPGVGTSQQYVIFMPDDTDNYNTVRFQIDVTISSPTTISSDDSDTNSTPTQTTVRNGTASTVVSSADGSKLVKEAAANQSTSVVIKPEVTSDVTKAQVSIPASTVGQIKDETNAALTVSVPIADVTIHRSAMDTLSSAGGTVDVVTEQVNQSVVLTLTADGKTVENVPGGVTLTIPAADAGPGTVAVLVHDDGTRETVRKSVVEDGKVSIPLNGSATVEIVDNSKEFTDVPPTTWAADAAAFASAHELFSGTSETTFSPDQPMSRGMLATVLYRLEGCPAQDKASEFSDVGSDAWYADGVTWAAKNGITDGYGDGQFGPDDSITREQFTVMLWKYAGSPEPKDKNHVFTDVDQASNYAIEALCWAVENGVLSGYGNGRLAPRETATRAEAAQMLKKFIENT